MWMLISQTKNPRKGLLHDEWRSQPIGYGKKYKDLTWDMLADQDLQYLQWMAQKAEKISDDKKQKALHMLSLKPLEDRYGRS